MARMGRSHGLRVEDETVKYSFPDAPVGAWPPVKMNTVSLVGGILGIISLVLPWFAVTVSALGVSLSVGANGFQVLFGLASAFGGGVGTVDLGAGASLMMVGVVLVLVGSILSFLKWFGGIITLLGSVLGLVGGFMIGGLIPPTPGLSVGPSYGIYLALIAGIISFLGGWWWARNHPAVPPVGMPPAPMGPPMYQPPQSPPPPLGP